MKVLSIFFALLVFQSNAKAAEGIVFSPTLMYRSEATKEANSSGESESTEIFIHLKLGYHLSSGLYLGAVYDIETDDAGLASTEGDRKSYGATVGYIANNGFNAFFSYLLNSTNNLGNDKYEGTGFIVDIGYSILVGSWGIGPVLQYRKFSYDKRGGTDLNSPREETLVLPMLQLMFHF